MHNKTIVSRIKEIDIGNIAQFMEIASRSTDNFLFRGQPGKYYTVSSSLERAIGENLEKQHEVEQQTLKLFKARAHHYIPSPPGMDDDVEWLSLMQHHGAPTRLIDVTESFYVAAYFAVQSSIEEKSSASIWCFSKEAINSKFYNEYNEQQKQYFPVPCDLMTTVQHQLLLNNMRGIRNGEGKYTSSVHIIIIEPQRINERMIAQKGKFLASLGITKPFMINLFASNIAAKKEDFRFKKETINDFLQGKSFEDPNYILKINIPENLLLELSNSLDKMNINEATLFPGIDGFARSLRCSAFSKFGNIAIEKNKDKEIRYYQYYERRLKELHEGENKTIS